MKKILVVLAVVSLILSVTTVTSACELIADPPYKCGKIEKVVSSPYGYDVVYRVTNCGKCVVVKMLDGKNIEWRYCSESSRDWKDIPKKDQ